MFISVSHVFVWFFFFFKQKTAYEMRISDWSSDVCSSDLGFYAKPKLLIVDELGYLPFETNAAHLFFQLVSRRYERGSMLVTSNRSVGEWGSVFGDAVVATAILDRLLHHSHVITIRGDSYRLREKRRAGLVTAMPAEPAKGGWAGVCHVGPQV